MDPQAVNPMPPESLEARLFRLEDIPWEELAFSAVEVALRWYARDALRGRWRYRQAVIRKELGAGPNVPGTYCVTQTVALGGEHDDDEE
ncbi:hypothetical protein H632_c345p1 [Helicosporidium sp. ATCC 50920]|nr:hypothetical protein H632_c345p1 [Helicosporidium sp. ATCC 50920]|eukprot:KDD76125.1 hypothetical protein H632_c345p1 [Helicosporidium sp. ATCC 50920]